MTNGNGKWPLPEGWVWTALGDVCNINMGQSPPSDTYNTEGIGLPFFQGKAEFGPLYPTPVKWCSKPQKVSDPGDILLSVRAPVGSTNLNRELSCIGRGLAAIKPPKEMNNLYFLYYLRYSEQDLIDQATGTTFQAVSGKVVRNHPIPLASISDQHRIVAEIEKQFTRLDAAVAALKRAKANLARYKAAVLKAAVEGRLVPQDPNDEPAAALLARILAERRAQWEAANPKKQYVEPKRPDVDGLPELPVGWVWATLSQLSNRITDGTHQPPQFVDEGIPFIFVQHIVGGSITFRNTKFITQETYERLNNRCPVEVGDILYTAVGSYGVAVPVQTKERFSFQRHIAHIKLASAELTSYLVVFLNSSLGIEQAHLVARGVAQKTVTLGDLTKFVIALPPLKEQHRIVTEVERQLSVLRANERIIDSNLVRAERLRQGVLGKAFRGELVP